MTLIFLVSCFFNHLSLIKLNHPLVQLPKPVHLAALIVLILHIDQLKPDVSDEGEGAEYKPKEDVWQDEAIFQVDFEHAKETTLRLCNLALDENSMVYKDAKGIKFAHVLKKVFGAFEELVDKCLEMRVTYAPHEKIAKKVVEEERRYYEVFLCDELVALIASVS